MAPTPISTNDPIRISLLNDLYDYMLVGLQPALETSPGGAIPTGTVGWNKQVQTTSATFAQIDPSLNLTFVHDKQRAALVLLTIGFAVTTATTVAEVGISIDGTIEPTSLMRFSANATPGIRSHQTYLFPIPNQTFSPVFTMSPGSHLIVPMYRIVSGAGATFIAYITPDSKTIMKDL